MGLAAVGVNGVIRSHRCAGPGHDIAVDLREYLTVIGERHDLSDDSEVELCRGQFHDVVLTARCAFRFPRSEAARVPLPERAAVLTALNEAGLGFAVPEPLAPVDAAEPVGRCFLVTTRVPGRPLTIEGAAARKTDDLGTTLGRVLVALANATEALRPLVTATPSRWTQFAVDVEQDLFGLMSAKGRARAQRELAAVVTLPAPVAPSLVHGDLGGDNLLWQPGRPPRLASVIDWDGLFLGSPANDVASIAATYGWPVAAEAAHAIDDSESLLQQARRIQATFALQQALPAARSGDIANLDDGLHRYR